MSLPLGLLLASAFGSAALPPTLALADAVTLAQQHHPEVRRAEAAVQQAMARRVGAALVLRQSPELSVDVGHRHDRSGSHPASTGLEWTVRLGQAVDLAGQRGLRLREVGWARSVAELQLQEARLQAGANGATDYLRAQAAEASVEVARARAELAERVLRMVRAKERAGATGGLERTLAEVEHGDARAQLQRALATQQAAREALWYGLGLASGTAHALAPLAPPPSPPSSAGTTAQLGVSDGAELTEEMVTTFSLAPSVDAAPSAAPAPPPSAADADPVAHPEGLPLAALLGSASVPPAEAGQALQLAQQAARQRPQGQALLAIEQGLQASLARLTREAVPSPTFAFEAQKQQPGQQYFGGGISLPLPLVQRQQGPRAEAEAAIRRNRVERRLFAAQCHKEASVALRQLAAAAAVWRTVHHEQLPAAQAHVDMTVAAWKAGKLDLAQVVQSLRYLTEARQRHTDALEALWRARIERNRVLGELP